MEDAGPRHLFPDYYAPFSELTWEIVVVDPESRKQDLLFLTGHSTLRQKIRFRNEREGYSRETYTQRLMGFFRCLPALLHEGPKCRVV